MAAFDFDLTCAFRHEIYENMKAEAQAKRIAFEVCKMAFGGEGDDSGDDGADVW